MLILGLNSFHPDSSACIFVDGKLVAAVAEERLGQRKKHVAGFPGLAIKSVLKMASATKAVEVTIVPAAHDSSVTRGLLSEAERKNLEPDNLSLPLGPPSGYVVRFTNGLVVYFTGDTAVHADQKTVVADFHRPNLMVLNLGLSAITMASGAYIANDIVRPATVVITHPNEAATQGGKARPGSRTEQLTALLKSPTVLSVSGRTIEFDGLGKCVAGCS